MASIGPLYEMGYNDGFKAGKVTAEQSLSTMRAAVHRIANLVMDGAPAEEIYEVIAAALSTTQPGGKG